MMDGGKVGVETLNKASATVPLIQNISITSSGTVPAPPTRINSMTMSQTAPSSAPRMNSMTSSQTAPPAPLPRAPPVTAPRIASAPTPQNPSATSSQPPASNPASQSISITSGSIAVAPPSSTISGTSTTAPMNTSMTSSQVSGASSGGSNPVMSALKSAMVMGPSAKAGERPQQVSNESKARDSGNQGTNPSSSAPPATLLGGIKVIHAPPPPSPVTSVTTTSGTSTRVPTSTNVVTGSVTISSRTVTVTTAAGNNNSNATPSNIPTASSSGIAQPGMESTNKGGLGDGKKGGNNEDPAAKIESLLAGMDAIRKETIESSAIMSSQNYNKAPVGSPVGTIRTSTCSPDKKNDTVRSGGGGGGGGGGVYPVTGIGKDVEAIIGIIEKDAKLVGCVAGKSGDKSAGNSSGRAVRNGSGREAGSSSMRSKKRDEKKKSGPNEASLSTPHEFGASADSRATPKPQKTSRSSGSGVNGNSRVLSASHLSSTSRDPATKSRSQSATTTTTVTADLVPRKKKFNVQSKVDSGLRSSTNLSTRPTTAHTLPKRSSSTSRTSLRKTRPYVPGKSFEMGDAAGESGEKATLKGQFTAFSRFGDATSDGKQISLTNSDKWMKQAQVIDGKKITTTDTSILFKKLFKTAKKVGFEDFKKYVEELATGKKLEPKELLDKLTNCGPPSVSHATKAAHVGVVDRLTDTSKYTGSHKERFDSAGRGRGIEGRRDAKDGSGYTAAFKTKLAAEKTPVAPASPAK